uniref:Uncharacterized protein n=1 Tax=Arundo donax TaxID=35708 RepID=A0A0A8XSM8_ARUDO
MEHSGLFQHIYIDLGLAEGVLRRALHRLGHELSAALAVLPVPEAHLHARHGSGRFAVELDSARLHPFAVHSVNKLSAEVVVADLAQHRGAAAEPGVCDGHVARRAAGRARELRRLPLQVPPRGVLVGVHLPVRHPHRGHEFPPRRAEATHQRRPIVREIHPVVEVDPFLHYILLFSLWIRLLDSVDRRLGLHFLLLDLLLGLPCPAGGRLQRLLLPL